MYTGESERSFGVREKEYKRDVSSLEEIKFTRARKKYSVSGVYPSAITDHIARNNHTLDWEVVKFPSKDSDTTKRDIWEAIAIKKTGAYTMN